MALMTSEHNPYLLLCEQLDDVEICELLSSVGFADWRAAYYCLGRIADDPQTKRVLAALLPHFLATLAGAANPDRVLVSFERFANILLTAHAQLRYW
jgi:glutamine synthetase adenylyltransferase